MLPKSVRCRKHVEVAEFIRERAGERSDGVIGLIAEHFARAAALGSEAGTRPRRARRAAGPGARVPRGRGRRGGRPLLERRGLRPLHRGARDLRVARARDRRPDRREAGRRRAAHGTRGRGGRRSGSAASTTTAPRRTSRASPTCTARSAPRSGTRASAGPRSTTTSAASTCSRTGRRASSWCASTRRPPRSTCTPATTCSRSTPRRRRCASPSGWARRGPPAAPTGSSAASSAASATPRRRARTSSARSRWRASRIAPRRSGPCSRSATTSRSPRPTTTGAAAAYREALEIAQEVGDLPSQVELHASLGQLAVDSADWEAVEEAAEASASLAEREGLHGKLCFPDLMRGVLSWRAGDWEEAAKSFRRAHELGEQVGRSEVAFNALYWLADAPCARAATSPPPRRSSPGRSTSASAPA